MTHEFWIKTGKGNSVKVVVVKYDGESVWYAEVCSCEHLIAFIGPQISREKVIERVFEWSKEQ